MYKGLEINRQHSVFTENFSKEALSKQIFGIKLASEIIQEKFSALIFYVKGVVVFSNSEYQKRSVGTW